MEIDKATDMLVDRVNSELGSADTWARRDNYGYPNSLALCTIDSIQSLGVKYGSVEKVVAAYIKEREAAGGHPWADGVDDLLNTLSESKGGSDGWSERMNNRHRTSTSGSAVLKSEAIRLAAVGFKSAGVQSTADLRALDPERFAAVKKVWLAVPGQRSGISWRYMLMLAGIDGVKPDRMILRFVAQATSMPYKEIKPAVAAQIVEAAAARLGTTATELDHAIWAWQRNKRRGATEVTAV